MDCASPFLLHHALHSERRQWYAWDMSVAGGGNNGGTNHGSYMDLDGCDNGLKWKAIPRLNEVPCGGVALQV